jgi:hypothetical protein
MTAMILRSDKVSLPSLGPCSTTGIYVYESANDVSDSNQLTMTSDHVIPGSRVPTTRLSYWALSPRCLSSLKTISTMMPGSGACIVIVLTTPTSLKKTHTIHCRTSRDTYAFHAPPHKQLAALVERGVAYPPLGFIGMLGGCPGSNQEPETMAPLGIAKQPQRDQITSDLFFFAFFIRVYYSARHHYHTTEHTLDPSIGETSRKEDAWPSMHSIDPI